MTEKAKDKVKAGEPRQPKKPARVRKAKDYKVGQLVKIRHSLGKAEIIEVRGPLGPGGMTVYRVSVKRWPRPAVMEVNADQIVRAVGE